MLCTNTMKKKWTTNGLVTIVSLSLLDGSIIKSKTKILSKKILLVPLILITMTEMIVKLVRRWRSSSRDKQE